MPQLTEPNQLMSFIIYIYRRFDFRLSHLNIERWQEFTFIHSGWLKAVVATKCPFRTDFWSDAYCPLRYRSSFGGRSKKNVILSFFY